MTNAAAQTAEIVRGIEGCYDTYIGEGISMGIYHGYMTAQVRMGGGTCTGTDTYIGMGVCMRKSTVQGHTKPTCMDAGMNMYMYMVICMSGVHFCTHIGGGVG